MQQYSEQTITDSYGANEEGYAKMKWEGNLLFSRCEKCRLKWKQIIVKPLAASMTMNGAVHVNKSFICLYNFFLCLNYLSWFSDWAGWEDPARGRGSVVTLSSSKSMNDVLIEVTLHCGHVSLVSTMLSGASSITSPVTMPLLTDGSTSGSGSRICTYVHSLHNYTKYFDEVVCFQLFSRLRNCSFSTL